MSAMSIRVAVRYIGGLIGAILFVGLLTLIFSFLGTIMCAVLAGMMLGATKLGRWQTLALSLIFPAVIFIVLRTSKADLAGRQIEVISLVCFAAFWLTYIVAAALITYEHQGQGSRASGVTGGTTQLSKIGSACRTATEVAVQPAPEVVQQPARGLTLEVLQGTWCCTAGCNGQRRDKTMHIQQETVILSVADSAGRIRIVTRAEIRVGNSQSAQLVRFSAEESDTLISI